MNPPARRASARFSVVIPAHGAAGTIGRCLQSFLPGLEPGEAEVVVVTHGSVDHTADVAASHDGVRVVELAEGSRAAALNAGDAAVAAFPRLYVDPRSVVSVEGLRLLAEELDGAAPLVAAPTERVVADSGSRWVDSYYAVHDRLPRPDLRAAGFGVYGLSEAGRRRFAAFPEGEDDQVFIRRCFALGERRVVRVAAFEVDAPRGLRELVARRSDGLRVRLQDGELRTDLRSVAGRTVKDVAGAVRQEPRLAARAALYTGVEAASLLASRTSSRPVPPQRTSAPASADGRALGRQVVVDGVAFDHVTEDDVLRRVLGDLAVGRGGLILTPNVDILRQLRRPENAELPERARIVVADGAPIVWASRVAGDQLPERVTGSSLIWTLSGAAAGAGRRVMLLGGADGVAERAAQRLEDEHPDLLRVHWHFPPFGFDADEAGFAEVVEVIKTAEPDIVFVGLGFPRQERLSLRLQELFPSTWFVGCGGSITMLAGDVARAPRWMQANGVEWLHRLVSEPRRLARRYLVDDVPYALAMLGRTAARRLRRR